MPAWDSAFLLADLIKKAGLQTAHEYDVTTELYPRLAVAQTAVIREIAARAGYRALYQTPTALTAAADRKTFTFGNDAQGNAILPMGWVQIGTSLSAFSGDSFDGWIEGQDFLDEGIRIRIPGNRTWAGTLYGRWVPTPPDITASVASVLNPADARELISAKAAEDWAGEGDLAGGVQKNMERFWAKRFPVWMLTWKNRYKGGGALTNPARWYASSSDLTTQ